MWYDFYVITFSVDWSYIENSEWGIQSLFSDTLHLRLSNKCDGSQASVYMLIVSRIRSAEKVRFHSVRNCKNWNVLPINDIIRFVEIVSYTGDRQYSVHYKLISRTKVTVVVTLKWFVSRKFEFIKVFMSRTMQNFWSALKLFCELSRSPKQVGR